MRAPSSLVFSRPRKPLSASEWSPTCRAFLPSFISISYYGTSSIQKAAYNGRGSSMTTQQRMEARRKEQLEGNTKMMERNFTRNWKSGDVYAPHDLSAAEARKWKKKLRPTMDAFDALSLNPLDQYKNFSIMSEYMTEMGRIQHSKETGLRPVNQRKIAKAIRSAIGLGLMPSVHRHPEIIKREMLGDRFAGRGY